MPDRQKVIGAAASIALATLLFSRSTYAAETIVNAANCSFAAGRDIQNVILVCNGTTEELIRVALKQTIGPIYEKLGDISKQLVVLQSTTVPSQMRFSYNVSVPTLRAAYKSEAIEHQPWLKCSNGICYYAGISSILPAVRRLHLGQQPNWLNRLIDVPQIPDEKLVHTASFLSPPASARQDIPAIPNTDFFLQMEFFDGSLSSIVKLTDKNDNSAIRGAALLPAPPDALAPLVLTAFDPLRSTWEFLPAQPGTTIKSYSTDQGLLYDADRPTGTDWNYGALHLRETPPNGYIRLSFNNNENSMKDPFRYEVPLNLMQDANAAVFWKNASHLVVCKRFTAAMLGLTSTENKNNFKYQMDQVNINMGLNAAGWSFISQPAVACMIPSLLPPTIKPAIKALQAVRLTSRPDTEKPLIAAVRQSDANAASNPGELRNLMHALLPLDSAEVDIKYKLLDGSESAEIRVPIEQ